MAIRKNDKKRKFDKFSKIGREVQIKLDRKTLELIINYLAINSPLITRINYNNLQKLFNMMSMKTYESDMKSYELVNFIKVMLEARIQKGLNNISAITTYCLQVNNSESFNEIVSNIDSYVKEMNDNEIKMLNKSIIDKVKYAFIVFYKDILMQDFDDIDVMKEKSYESVVNIVKEDITHLMAEMRAVQDNADMNTFSLEPGVFEASVTNAVNKLKNKSRRFYTGIKGLNTILAPGFHSGKLYMFLARTGNFKSGILLSIARWVKTLNKNIMPKKNPDALPTVLLITTENSIMETVERLFNMTVPFNDIETMSPVEVINEFKTTGGMTITKENFVNIRIEYRNDRELDTNDIYGMIEDIEMAGCEVVMLIVDYIKRIRASESGHGDERIELKNCSSELKNLAENLDIPVVTAMQINRVGNQLVEQAEMQEKEDLAKFMGATNVANCWDLMENSDWVCIINVEKHKTEPRQYLTFKLVKIRYADRSKMLTYFNQPFEENDTIRLMEDYALEKPLYVLSLSTGDLKKEIKEEKNVPKTRKKTEQLPSIDFNQFALGVDSYLK